MRGPSIDSSEERQAMIKREDVVAELRRDVSFVGNAVVAFLFSAFAGLAIAAALYDLVAIHR